MSSYFRPVVSDPYPESWDKITNFHYLSRLELGRDPKALMIRKSRESCYTTLSDYRVDMLVDSRRWEITVPKGMLTDLTSVPRLFRNSVVRVGPHLEAAIVHDYLYIAWQLFPNGEARRQDWKFANHVMYAGLDAANIGWAKRKLIRAALSAPYFSWSVYRERDDGNAGMDLFITV